jgi:hypothetical protein
MKLFKASAKFLIAWAIILFLLFGSTIFYKVSSSVSNEIEDLTELNAYKGYTVKKLKTDWFGNWVVIKKGLDQEVLNCSDSVFSQLSVGDYLGK